MLHLLSLRERGTELGPRAQPQRNTEMVKKKVVLGCVFPPLYAGASSRNLGNTCFILFKNSLDKRPFGAS